ncbi:hypothetical protein C7S18_12980 [Ahniella affigens]|uniref:Uncharacterized protein n=1 Tax=Ahniella affigens TaxID=2021234 RepID=A0A2P1PT95_9GAMM|nr:hypothetical protein [Ahniella affigens]AVP98056.1 hypothetical protein C7S18_12980 [Ahniella affigens]
MLPAQSAIARLSAALLLAGVSSVALAQTAEFPLIVPESASAEDPAPSALSTLSALFGLSDDRGTLAMTPVPQLANANLVIAVDAESGNPTLPWCAEPSGLLRIGRLGSECLMSGRLELELPGQVSALQMGLGWQGDSVDIGLVYGWSWQVSPNDVAPTAGPIRTDLSPTLPALTSSFDSRQLGAAAQWRLTSRSAVQLNAALSQLKLWSGNARPVWDVDQAALGMGLRYGSFGGSVRGRVARFQDPLNPNSTSFGGLDIGVSWRTPWAGELTVGADNLVIKRDNNGDGGRVVDEATARTPYVIYKQDL